MKKNVKLQIGSSKTLLEKAQWLEIEHNIIYTKGYIIYNALYI